MKIVAKVLLIDEAGSILLLKRNLTHPNFPGHVDFPGGEVEPGEQYDEAVIREVQEETGLDLPLANLELVYTKQLTEGLTHVVFVANIANSKPSVELSWEHSGFEWLPLNQFASAPLPSGVDNYHLTVLDYLGEK